MIGFIRQSVSRTASGCPPRGGVRNEGTQKVRSRETQTSGPHHGGEAHYGNDEKSLRVEVAICLSDST